MPTPTFPIQKKFSERTSGSYGFKDGHTEISVKIGILPRVSATLAGSELGEAIAFLQEAKKFADLSQEDRDRMGVD